MPQAYPPARVEEQRQLLDHSNLVQVVDKYIVNIRSNPRLEVLPIPGKEQQNLAVSARLKLLDQFFALRTHLTVTTFVREHPLCHASCHYATPISPPSTLPHRGNSFRRRAKPSPTSTQGARPSDPLRRNPPKLRTEIRVEKQVKPEVGPGPVRVVGSSPHKGYAEVGTGN